MFMVPLPDRLDNRSCCYTLHAYALFDHVEAHPMKGVVVCPQPRAADVGAAVLAKGGNAFDAAVATAFSQMVNDPFMCGIGGMGTLHYYRADEGRSGMVDFYNRAGSKVRPD